MFILWLSGWHAFAVVLHPRYDDLQKSCQLVFVVCNSLGTDTGNFCDFEATGFSMIGDEFSQASAVIEGVVEWTDDQILALQFLYSRHRCAYGLQKFLGKACADHEGTIGATQIHIIAHRQEIGQQKPRQSSLRCEHGHRMNESAAVCGQRGVFLIDRCEQDAVGCMLGIGFLEVQEEQGAYALSYEERRTSLRLITNPGDDLEEVADEVIEGDHFAGEWARASVSSHVEAKGVKASAEEEFGGGFVEFNVFAEVVDKDNGGPFAVDAGPALDVDDDSGMIDGAGEGHVMFGFYVAVIG